MTPTASILWFLGIDIAMVHGTTRISRIVKGKKTWQPSWPAQNACTVGFFFPLPGPHKSNQCRIVQLTLKRLARGPGRVRLQYVIKMDTDRLNHWYWIVANQQVWHKYASSIPAFHLRYPAAEGAKIPYGSHNLYALRAPTRRPIRPCQPVLDKTLWWTGAARMRNYMGIYLTLRYGYPGKISGTT